MFARLLLVALLFLPKGAAASPFTGLVVLGDSLSDLGNTSAATLGIEPGSGYAGGRFSNGELFVERLAAGLGLPAPTRSGAGGDVFSYGGSETNGPGGLAGLFVDSFVEQVDDYLGRLGGGQADPTTLHVVLIGANDLLNGQTNVNAPVGVIETQLGRLATAGVQRVLGINLPLLGLTPDRNGNAAGAAAINALTVDFNNALAAAYEAVESEHAGLTIDRIDLETQISQIVATPDRWGFTNVTDQGIAVAGGTLDAPGYLFWDNVHPTREAHALLGEAAIREALPEGDYDRDGVVSPGDYGEWTAGYGAVFDAFAGVTIGVEADANGDGRVDAADYTVWRDALAPTAIAVPEPGTRLLGALALVCAGGVGGLTAGPRQRNRG